MAFITGGELAQVGLQIGSLALIVKILTESRRNNGKGSRNEPCPLHKGIVKDIEANKTDIGKELANFHKENREDHQQMGLKIDNVSTSVVIASEAARTAAAAAAAAASTAAAAAQVASNLGKR